MSEIHPRILQAQIDALRAEMNTMREDERAAVETGGRPPNHPPMDNGWRSSVDNRLGELKGALEGLRSSFAILAGAVGLVATVMVIGFGFFGLQFNRLDGRIDQLATKIDAIPQRLSEEFRAMRAEMAAQTSAIANAVTATHQAQSPAPQIIIVPTPQPQPTPKTPRP